MSDLTIEMSAHRAAVAAAMKRLLVRASCGGRDNFAWRGCGGVAASEGSALLWAPWGVDVDSTERKAIATVAEWAALPATHQVPRSRLVQWIGDPGDWRENCYECHGAGEVECVHCNHWGECQECGGNGEVVVPIEQRPGDARTFHGFTFDGTYLATLSTALAHGVIGVGLHEQRGDFARLHLTDHRGVVAMVVSAKVPAGPELDADRIEGGGDG